MHLLVGKPALEALVRDIDVEAETHFMVFAKYFGFCNRGFLVRHISIPKPILVLLAKYFGFLHHTYIY